MKDNRPKTIFINGKFLSQNITGVQRYAMELVRAMDAELLNNPAERERISFVLLSPRRTIQELPLRVIEHRRIGRMSSHLWEHIELPLYVKSSPLFNPFTGPPLKTNQAVTLHDPGMFAVPSYYSFKFRIFYKSILLLFCRFSEAVATDSEFSRSELSRYCGRSLERIRVIYPGSDHILRIQPDDSVFKKFGIDPDRPYVLGVSSLSPHKNFRGLAAAMEKLGRDRPDLVVVGGVNKHVFSENRLPASSKNHFVGYVSDGQLKSLYLRAACFAFPSFYEGFGFPALEAMHCGLPVVLSSAASLPEIGGNAAVYCDPGDPDSIAGAIQNVLTDPKLRLNLQKKGHDRAGSFTWRRCAREMIDFLIQTFIDT